MAFPRQRVPELMDDPALDHAEHRRALRDLARLNRLTRVDSPVWDALVALPRDADRPLRILDVGTGSGDLLLSFARSARAAGIPIDLHGCDISPIALEAARTQTQSAGHEVALHRVDVLRDPLPAIPGGFDAACCGLFLHHFDPPQVQHILRAMANAARAVIVQDLRRSRIGLGLAHAFPRMFSRSRIVHIDAVRSVHAAYTVEEMTDMARAAGLSSAQVRPLWPQRLLLTWQQD